MSQFCTNGFLKCSLGSFVIIPFECGEGLSKTAKGEMFGNSAS